MDEKIFAIGGGNGIGCFSNVEMLDLIVGRWIYTRSMLQKVNVVHFSFWLKESGFEFSCHRKHNSSGSPIERL